MFAGYCSMQASTDAKVKKAMTAGTDWTCQLARLVELISALQEALRGITQIRSCCMYVIEVAGCHEANASVYALQVHRSAMKAHGYMMHGAMLIALMLVGKCLWAQIINILTRWHWLHWPCMQVIAPMSVCLASCCKGWAGQGLSCTGTLLSGW